MASSSLPVIAADASDPQAQRSECRLGTLQQPLAVTLREAQIFASVLPTQSYICLRIDYNSVVRRKGYGLLQVLMGSSKLQLQLSRCWRRQ